VFIPEGIPPESANCPIANTYLEPTIGCAISDFVVIKTWAMLPKTSSWRLISVSINPFSIRREEEEAFDNSKVYPNPTTDHITIDFGTMENVESIVLRDLTGKVVYTSNIVTTQLYKIDITGCPGGVYLLNVKTANEIKSYKLIRQ